MTYTDTQLKLAMAKLLPEKIKIQPQHYELAVVSEFFWKHNGQELLETEWFYVIHLVEQTLTAIEWLKYMKELSHVVWGTPITMECTTRLLWESTFNQRATAMCKVKGIEV